MAMINAMARQNFPGEPVEAILRRFKKDCEKQNHMVEWKRHQFFSPKGVRRREKSIAARRRLEKAQAMNAIH